MYDPRSSKHVADTLRKNFLAMVETDNLCKKVFKRKILVVNERGQTLKEKLMRVKLPGRVDLGKERAEIVRKFNREGGDDGETNGGEEDDGREEESGCRGDREHDELEREVEEEKNKGRVVEQREEEEQEEQGQDLGDTLARLATRSVRCVSMSRRT